MRTYYAQPLTQSAARVSTRELQLLESVPIETKESANPDLTKIYQSLRQNFKARNFSLFSEDKLTASPKKKSLSRRKLDKLKLQLPRLPRIKHGDSKTSRKPVKEDGMATLGKTITRQSSFLNHVFRSHSKKRTKSDLVNRSSNKILPQFKDSSVMRMTIGMPSRKESIRNIKQPPDFIINERLREIVTARTGRPLVAKQINLELESLEEREFLNMMRSYNYLKVGPNLHGSYRAYVRPGNNSELIKRCLKARGCWVIAENEDEEINLLWSQLRVGKFTKRLEARTPGFVAEASPIKPLVVSEKLLEQFIATRMNEFPLLTAAQMALQKDMFRAYLNKVLGLASRSTPKSTEFYRLTELLERRRPKYELLDIPNPHTARLHNHVEGASNIGNKKALLFYMRSYYEQQGLDPFLYIPETVHIASDVSRLTQEAVKTLLPFGLPCILKPGEFTNRGNGITVHTDWKSLMQTLASIRFGSVVIQRYLTPFLYKARKFDVRVWVLCNGRQAWWYREGYIRTASKEFSMSSTNRFVHLTNDAVQKYSDTYGKHEQGNKISFNEFQKYLDFHEPSLNFWQTVYPQMKRLAKDVFRVAAATMDQRGRMFGCQLFGLDFMVDSSFKAWLIEVNTNPCLQTSCTLLTRLVTNMVDNLMSIAVDPLFPPPENRHRNFSFESNFKFELLYDWYTDKEQPFQPRERKFQDNSECSDTGSDSDNDG